MIVRKHIAQIFYFFFSVLIFTCSSSKAVQNKKVISATIIFKKYHDLTNYDIEKDEKVFAYFFKNFIDTIGVSVNNLKLESKEDSILFKKYFDENGIPNANFLHKTNNDTSLIRFEIYKDFYFLPKYIKNSLSDNKSYKKGEFINSGKKIIRNSLKSCITGRSKKCSYTSPYFYYNENKYIIEVFKNDKKKILGYNCFKIRVKYKKAINGHYDLYATNEIMLDYNPLMNFKSINDKNYFVLEKIEYVSNVKIITRASNIKLN